MYESVTEPDNVTLLDIVAVGLVSDRSSLLETEVVEVCESLTDCDTVCVLDGVRLNVTDVEIDDDCESASVGVPLAVSLGVTERVEDPLDEVVSLSLGNEEAVTLADTDDDTLLVSEYERETVRVFVEDFVGVSARTTDLVSVGEIDSDPVDEVLPASDDEVVTVRVLDRA